MVICIIVVLNSLKDSWKFLSSNINIHVILFNSLMLQRSLLKTIIAAYSNLIYYSAIDHGIMNFRFHQQLILMNNLHFLKSSGWLVSIQS